jgi:hypothetical protein
MELPASRGESSFKLILDIPERTTMSRWHHHPILCLYRAPSQPWRRYLSELLAQQGFFQCDHLDLDHTKEIEGELQGRALLLVSASQVSAAEAAAIGAFVRSGGAAVLIAPPDDLLPALGLSLSEPASANYGSASWGYARLMDHPDAGDHAGTLLQVPTPMTLRKVAGQNVVASFSARTDIASNYPSVITAGCGQGELGIFWFELGEAAVWLRQGDPARAAAARTGIATLKPGFLFERHMDPHLRQCPQGDVWADVLTNMIHRLAEPRLPQPRVWHFPDHAPALTLLDGDSDIYDWDCYLELSEPARAVGVPYTLNLMAEHLQNIDRARVDSLWQQGQDFQLHYWPADGGASIAGMQQAIDEQTRLFASATGRPATGGRAHCLVWPGYTEVAAALADGGFQIETNFMPFRGWQYGYLGSARPARYITTTGQWINVYQQPTVFMDDPMSNDKSLLPAHSPDGAYRIVEQYYEESVSRYHGVICTCLHPVPKPGHEHYRAVQVAMRQAIMDAATKQGVPAVTTRQWGAFVHARAQLDLRWDGTGWQLSAGAAIERCTVLLQQRGGWNHQTLNLPAGGRTTLTW